MYVANFDNFCQKCCMTWAPKLDESIVQGVPGLDLAVHYCIVLLIGETGAVSIERLPSADRLSFHPRCGLHAAVINNQCTAHRPQ